MAVSATPARCPSKYALGELADGCVIEGDGAVANYTVEMTVNTDPSY